MPSLILSSSSASATAPLPAIARLTLTGLLVLLLSFFLTTHTWAQPRSSTQRTPVKRAAASSNVGIAGTQSYKTGIGLRAGSPTAVSIKHFYKGNTAVEALIGTRFGSRGFYAGLLIEQHATAFQSRGLRWYYGLGGHASSYQGRYYYAYGYKKNQLRYEEAYDDRFWGVGIDGVLGLEYQLSELQFTIGADLKPFAELVRSDGYFGVDAALTVRYVF